MVSTKMEVMDRGFEYVDTPDAKCIYPEFNR